MTRRFIRRSDNLRAAPRWITPDLVARLLAIAVPLDGAPMPIRTVPTRGAKPTLAIVPNTQPPVTHSRRSEERGAAANGPTPAASPPRKIKKEGTSKSVASAATTEPPGACESRMAVAESGTASSPGEPVPARSAAELTAVERGRRAHNELRAARAAEQIEADRPLFQIAFTRGISIVDLASALGQHPATVGVHARLVGLRFGKRHPLADALTREQLTALADPAMPLPELRHVRLKRQRVDKWNAYKRDKRAADVARRAAERAAAAEERRTEREKAKAQARRERETEREVRRAAKASKKQTPRQTFIREAEKAEVCRPVRPAPSREPAALPPPAPRAHPTSDRAKSDRANRRRSDGLRRSAVAKAEELLDAGKTARSSNVHVKIALRAVEQRRADQSRLADPVEQAKSKLRPHYAPVCSMAVYGGDPDLFIVGNRKNLPLSELLRLAARFAA